MLLEIILDKVDVYNLFVIDLSKFKFKFQILN